MNRVCDKKFRDMKNCILYIECYYSDTHFFFLNFYFFYKMYICFVQQKIFHIYKYGAHEMTLQEWVSGLFHWSFNGGLFH